MEKLVSRRTFGPAILRAGWVVLALAAAPAVRAQQQAPTSESSPAAPGDTSKPTFDTTTRVFDSVPDLKKRASTVVAEVEGHPITLGEVGDMIRTLPPALARLPFETLFPTVLQQLIRQQALIVRAQQRGMDEDPEVKRRLKAVADHELADIYLKREANKGITEARLLDRYNQDFAGRPGPEEVHARVIVCATEKEAYDQIAALKSGADFASIARQVSKDSTAAQGGDAGFVTRENMSPEVGAVALSLPVGAISALPVLTAGQWIILKIEARRLGPTPNFFAVREQLVQTLQREDAAQVASTALAGMTIREYDLTGKEKETDSPDKP
jgi:peptidyl-prolyl cis-trans isomerase C